NWVRGRTGLAGDTAVGIFFAVSVALGVLFLFLKREYTAEAFTYLFGSILAVGSVDLWLTGGVTLAALLTLPRLWGRWAYATFERDLARADRLPVERDDYLLSVLLAVTVVVAVKVVGIILVAAFLVIPAAAARLLTTTFRAMTVLSVGVGIVSALAGLLGSYALDVPSGATIILGQALVFFGAMGLRRRG
ncbi:MAG: metal ABC transporter permease, partial [Bacteroidetes bacterium]|nr:metal ABC transporter permease [Bacteroidota bacterium]